MRKGMSAGALALMGGIALLLLVLIINAALDPTSGFRDFLKKVPWLNKIVPSGGSGGGTPSDGSIVGSCGAVCTADAKPCPITKVCKNNECTDSAACASQSIGLPSGNVISFVGTTISSASEIRGDALRIIISDGIPSGESSRYIIKRGDTLEYDVLLPMKTPCTGGITVDTSDGDLNSADDWKDQHETIGTLRNCDEDPAKASKENDMTPYAYGKWYHRVLPLTKTGQTLNSVSLVMEGKTDDAIYIALYDNIVIKSSDGEHAIFKESLKKNDEDCGSFWTSCRFNAGRSEAGVRSIAYTPASKTSPQTNLVRSATGDIIRLKADSDGTSRYMYAKAFTATAPYTLRAGDIVEYDVYLGTCQDQVGGIELGDASGENLWHDNYYWDRSFDWVNGKVVSAKPDGSRMDLTEFACNKWYHRVLPAPPQLWGKPVQVSDLVIGKDMRDAPFLAYYDNIQITDGTGVVAGFYPSGAALFPPIVYDSKAGGINGFKNVEITITTPADISRPT